MKPGPLPAFWWTFQFPEPANALDCGPVCLLVDGLLACLAMQGMKGSLKLDSMALHLCKKQKHWFFTLQLSCGVTGLPPSHFSAW